MKFLLLLSLPCIAQPKWVSIATPSDAYQYFRYAGQGRIESDQFSSKSPHPASSFTYHFLHGDPGPRNVCALHDRPGVYWYSPEGRHLDGTFVTPSPSEFNVSTRQAQIHGFAVTTTFSGEAARPGAIEVVYLTDRACSDGGTEYGFSRDLATNSILVYWSTFANCANDGASLCRKTNTPSLGDRFSNVQQENGGAASEHGFRIYGLDPDVAYSYAIFIERRAFHVEVRRNKLLAECSENEQAARRPCSFVKGVQPWFPIDQLASGYIVSGTLNAGDSGVSKQTEFAVSDILVLK